MGGDSRISEPLPVLISGRRLDGRSYEELSTLGYDANLPKTFVSLLQLYWLT
jgi:hypothetical protein